MHIDTHTIEVSATPTDIARPEYKKSIANTNNQLVIALKDAREGQLRDQVAIVHIELVIGCVLYSLRVARNKRYKYKQNILIRCSL